MVDDSDTIVRLYVYGGNMLAIYLQSSWYGWENDAVAVV